MKKCPFCAEEIQDDAVKCRYCGEFLKPEPSGSQELESKKKPIGCGTIFLILLVIIILVIGLIGLIGSPSGKSPSSSYYGHSKEDDMREAIDFLQRIDNGTASESEYRAMDRIMGR